MTERGKAMEKGKDNLYMASEYVRFLSRLFLTAKRTYGRHQDDMRSGSRAFDVLFMLQVHGERPPTMSCLANELGISKQQLTKLINPLETRGLVRRMHDNLNRRQVHVIITPEGERAVDALLDAQASRLAPDMDVYTPEEKQDFLSCVSTIRRLLGKLEAAG